MKFQLVGLITYKRRALVTFLAEVNTERNGRNERQVYTVVS